MADLYRWQYPEDRFDIERWMAYRKRGYYACFGLTFPGHLSLTMDYRTSRIVQTVDRAALDTLYWRQKVAVALRKMRRELRRHDAIYSGYQT